MYCLDSWSNCRTRFILSFATLVRKRRRAWKSGRSLEVGKLLSDVQQQLPCLVAWAERFNAADEMWLLEGAVQTLSLWRSEPEFRDSLDIRGFSLLLCCRYTD